ncbi:MULTISPECIES: DUF4012 domain-containing protein [unclassified Rhodococcus (in: high G+C Gram-positive bacteria)]|uniref:DUF4012 domain-containing protein n=1 Tax=unclassified Rhodococcus (in: high G+C Gram-positive bacteria) TaxID=192944 RepID=UPI00211B63D7|nr:MULTISPECIES: DUF4012 domain-containing protein [unclassified Rhodococcus (in: high G+C Gram-positive bacteria)]
MSYDNDYPYGDHRSSRSRRRRRRSKKRTGRRILLGFGVVVVVALGLGAWLAYTANTAYTYLDQARGYAQAAKTALLAGDTQKAETSVDDAVRTSTQAKDATDSVIWQAAAAIPYVGQPLDVVSQITDVVNGLTVDVLTPSVEVGATLDPSQLRGPDGAIDIAALRAASPALSQAAAAADVLNSQSQAIAEPEFVAQVGDARTQLQDQTHELTTLLTNTDIAAKVLPAMLGADGPRNYFMAFQTLSESRGTGGLIGGFGIVRAVDGKVAVDSLASNAELRIPYDPIDLGPDFFNTYESRFQPTQNWQNSNVSPHFPYAGQIWQSMWEQETGERVDGALATDPVALGYILDVVGPITMGDGEVIDGSNVVRITQSDAYFRFEDDNTARKAYLQDIAARVVAKMQGNIGSPSALLEALGKATSEGHIAVWSADPALQAILGPTRIGHEVPDSPDPYAAVVVNNGAGGKLDYYLQRKVTYSAQSCDGPTRTTRVVAEITNNAALQDYTTYIAGRQNDSTRYDGPPGTNRSVVALYATQGATLTNATINGTPLFLLTAAERGHPVFYVPVVIEPGQTKTIEYNLVEPTVAGEAQAPVQPQSVPAPTEVDFPDCN